MPEKNLHFSGIYYIIQFVGVEKIEICRINTHNLEIDKGKSAERQ
jgi:hypothetical protein